MCRFTHPSLLVCLVASVLVTASALADPPPLRQANPALNVPATPPPTTYSLVDAFPGLSAITAPTCIATEPGNSQRLYVCEKAGVIKLIPNVNSPTSVTFFNLFNLVDPRTNEEFRTLGECGLLGLAFHPDYATNRQFFVAYSVRIKINGVMELHQRVARFTTSATNPNQVDTTAYPEYVLLEQFDDQGNHNGGDLHFGPDGYLYISVGDEGDQNDSELNSQRIDKDFFSGILRIDVDKRPGNLEPSAHPNPTASAPAIGAIKYDGSVARYSIPADNPFVGATTFNGLPVNATYVRSEFWAVGLRNPWRISFDGDDLWCGDVGGSKREEVNRIQKGKNYGWVYREGFGTGAATASHPAQPAGFVYENPVYAYIHTGTNGFPEIPSTMRGDSITGGRIYRGGAIGGLFGKYVFADHVSGHVWALNPGDASVERIAGEGGISAFGADPSDGDILAADLNGNKLLRLTGSSTTGSFPDQLSETGLFSSIANLTPAPGLIPYAVNLPFWSDHAIKRRWFTLPNAAATFTWSKDGLWTFPTGSIWVKHFDMEMQRGVPASKKRIETRVLVKNATGAYGVSYRWNEAGSEANLVADEGDEFTLAITENGAPVAQTWRIPGRAECMICHTSQAGFALSFNTRQLNIESDMSGHTGNQLTTLFNQGYLSNNPGSPNLLPRHLRPDESAYSVEARVRSYLAVNCSYCHKSGGTALGQWDGRPELTLDQTGLVNGEANNNGGNAANKLVVPGDTAHSIVLNRMAVTNGFTRMPPIGSNVIDSANVTLLTSWIHGDLAARQTYDVWRSSNFEPDNDPLGAPGADADADGSTNQDEFLAGTNPNSGASAFRPQVSLSPPKLSFTLPVNRSFRVDTSDNLGTWTPWDIPQNRSLPVAGGLIELAFPTADPQRFFRVELIEN